MGVAVSIAAEEEAVFADGGVGAGVVCASTLVSTLAKKEAAREGETDWSWGLLNLRHDYRRTSDWNRAKDI